MSQQPVPWRATAGWVAATGAVLFVLLAYRAVPWGALPESLPHVAAGDLFTPAQLRRADDYARWARVWSWSGLVVGLLVACWLGFGTAGRRLAERTRGPWPLRVVQTVAACLLAGWLATLPFLLAHVEHARRAGLTRQPWTGVLRDQLVGLALTIVVTAVAMVVLIGLIRALPRRWPAAAAALGAAFVLAGSFVYPVVVEPLFTTVTPLADGPLRSSILQLADREGVPVQDVLVADASRRTTTLNAYVSGFGATRRIVLYDTLVEGLDRSEAESVAAHELAHARHSDVLLGSLLGALGAAAGIGLLGLALAAGPVRRRTPTQLSLVPMVLALAALGQLAALPVQHSASRVIEARADADALRATGDPGAFERMQVRLAVTARQDPTPPAWSQWWFGTHPTVLQRVALARSLDDTGR